METKNKFRLGGWKQNLSRFTGLMIISFAVLISCQKKDSSNANNVAPLPINQAGIIGTCAGCNFAQVQLGQPTSYGTTSFPVSFQWNLLADQVAVQQLAYAGSSAKMYSGAIAATGTMTVSSQINLGYSTYYTGYAANGCVIPAATYQINTLQVGQMNQGRAITIPQFEAVSGTTRIIFSLTDGVVLDPNLTGTIAHITGQLKPIAAIVNGAQIACTDPGVYLSYY